VRLNVGRAHNFSQFQERKKKIVDPGTHPTWQNHSLCLLLQVHRQPLQQNLVLSTTFLTVYIWRVQMQKPLSANWNFLPEW